MSPRLGLRQQRIAVHAMRGKAASGLERNRLIDCRERELVLASMHSPPPHYAVFDPRFTLEQQLAEMFGADDPSARNTIC